MTSPHEVRGAAQGAVNSAAFLMVVAVIVGVLGGGISLLVAFLGFTPQCPAGDPSCLPSQRQPNVLVIAAGVTGTLAALSVFALLSAVAARVKLAGILALASTGAPAPQQAAVARAPVAGGTQPVSGGRACMRCGSRNVSSDRCRRCSGQLMTMTSSDGWYAVLGDPSRERFFNGETWDENKRPATRLSLQDWTGPDGQWLLDPSNPERDRYWDGTAWTNRVRDPWGDDEAEDPLG